MVNLHETGNSFATADVPRLRLRLDYLIWLEECLERADNLTDLRRVRYYTISEYRRLEGDRQLLPQTS